MTGDVSGSSTRREPAGAAGEAAARVPVGPAARYFEDFSVGEEFVTQGRTLTDTDRVLWSMFTGDLNPIHVDAHFAGQHSRFGEPIPQGLLSVAIASGLQERLGLFAGTGRAMLRQLIEYVRPLRVGDTLRVRLTVRDLAPDAVRGGGTVRFDVTIEAVERAVVGVRGELDVSVLGRPSE